MVERRANDVGNRTGELRLLAILISIFGVMVAVGFAMPKLIGARDAASPLALGDVSEAHIVEIRNQRGDVVVLGEFRSRIDPLGNTEKDAALVDQRGRRVIGEVEVEVPAPGRTDRRTELEVDIIGLPPRETFAVVIDDRSVGTFTTDDRGSVDMELQEGEVPPPVVEG
jgi:hypothetical protein